MIRNFKEALDDAASNQLFKSNNSNAYIGEFLKQDLVFAHHPGRPMEVAKSTLFKWWFLEEQQEVCKLDTTQIYVSSNTKFKFIMANYLLELLKLIIDL